MATGKSLSWACHALLWGHPLKDQSWHVNLLKILSNSQKNLLIYAVGINKMGFITFEPRGGACCKQQITRHKTDDQTKQLWPVPNWQNIAYELISIIF